MDFLFAFLQVVSSTSKHWQLLNAQYTINNYTSEVYPTFITMQRI